MLVALAALRLAVAVALVVPLALAALVVLFMAAAAGPITARLEVRSGLPAVILVLAVPVRAAPEALAAPPVMEPAAAAAVVVLRMVVTGVLVPSGHTLTLMGRLLRELLVLAAAAAVVVFIMPEMAEATAAAAAVLLVKEFLELVLVVLSLLPIHQLLSLNNKNLFYRQLKELLVGRWHVLGVGNRISR
jgi:hypothetical protein